ncbi:ciliary microtubule inner protein 2B [Polymixia lowei]
MEKSPPSFSKVLLTSDPQYIPGYTGHCPQLKWHLGKTYGQFTAKSLTSPEVVRPERSVLHTGRVPSTEADVGPRDEIWRRYHGKLKNLDRMIPGYTGFVPKRQNYFARTYAETCREALTEFDRDQRTRIHRQTTSLSVVSNYINPEFKAQKLNTPLTAISKELAPYKSLDSWKPMGSPYSMDDQNPYKYFISGFTGYVPKSRFIIGTSYPITTNKALIQFGKQFRSDLTFLDIQGKEGCTLPSIPTVYSSNRGLVPSYTGHVPGCKFMYGHTFGQLTHNALGKSDAKRKLEGKS